MKGVKYMTNTVELEIAIKRAGLTKNEVVKLLGLSNMGFYKKLHNITEFKASEIVKLCNILKIKNMNEVFFDLNVERKSTKIM